MSGDDVDLDALLESALEDFKKEPAPPAPKPTPVPKEPSPVTPATPPRLSPNDIPGMDGNDELFNQLLKDPVKALSEFLSNPELKDELERDISNMMKEFNLSEPPINLSTLEKELKELSSQEPVPNTSPSVPKVPSQPQPAPESPSEAPAGEGLSATLENLLNSAKDVLNTPELGEFSPESLQGMLADLENNPEMMGILENVMDRFMSKEVLHEGLTELQVKFREWLDKNNARLSNEEKAKYNEQLVSINKVLELYADDSAEISQDLILKQMESVGSLPEELLQDLGKAGGAPCTLI